MSTKTLLFHLLLLVIISVKLYAEEQRRINYAVINLKNTNGVDKGQADLISDRICVELFKTGKINIMEREQVREVLAEQGFQQSGACKDDACIVEMGQLLGVERLITGTIGKIDSLVLINIRVIEVVSGKILKVVSWDINGSTGNVVHQIPNVARDILGLPLLKDLKPNIAHKPNIQKNKPKKINRSNIYLSAHWFPGDLTLQYLDTTNRYQPEEKPWNKDFFEKLKDDTSYTEVFYHPVRLRFTGQYGIPLGKYFALNVGPSVSLWYINKGFIFSYTHTQLNVPLEADFYWKLMVLSPSISLNLSVVKSWKRMRFHGGFGADFNWNIIRFEQQIDYLTNYEGVEDSKYNRKDAAFNVSFGPRIGIEVMTSERIGLNADFQYKMNEINTDLDFLHNEADQKWKYQWDRFSFGAGMAFYFN